MAFVNRSVGSSDSVKPAASTGQVAAVDKSQIDKIKDSGFLVTPVSNDASTLQMGTPSTKQIMPGVTVDGYQDGRGNFYVVDTTGIVSKVDKFVPTDPSGNTVSLSGGGTPTRGDTGIIAPPLTYNPNVITDPPPQPIPPLSTNFGSGKIYSRFEVGDVVPNQQETITRALWSGNVGNLLTYYTSSAQTTTQKRYYYEVFNSASGDCGSEAQFSIAWGHKNGSGSADEGGQIDDTPSKAIYGQYRLLCLENDTPRFTIGGITTDSIYVVNVNRSRMREYLDEGNIELNLAFLSGSKYLAGGGLQNAHTGSNVKLLGGPGTGSVLRLVDDSRINNATVTMAGEVYQMVSGTIEDGVYNTSAPHVYGLLYRRLGIIVLSGDKLDQSASFLTVTGSEVPGDNAYKFFLSVSGAAAFTDASGDRLGFQGRSSERVKSTHYFCRVKNAEYNFSNNPTFVTGSEGDLAEPTFINDPKVYITTVGLYNDMKELVAVAKVSRAIQKSFTKEALIKVKLEF